MNPELRQTLIAKLRSYASRPRQRFDPLGCAYCVLDSNLWGDGSLCRPCTERLARLEAEEGQTVPDGLNTRTLDSPSGFTQAKYISTDPRFTRRSDAKGRRDDTLPFEEDPT